MIKEALQYITGLTKPEIIERDGLAWSDRSMKPMIHDEAPEPKVLTVHTLTAIIDYLASADHARTIHVQDYDKVCLYGDFEPKFGRRKLYVRAEAFDEAVIASSYIDQDIFVTSLLANFKRTDVMEKVLQVVGTVEESAIQTSTDDGYTQSVSRRIGIARKDNVSLPNLVTLHPYRSFPEIDPIGIDFVLRAKPGPKFALFPADGGRWRMMTILAIREYLQEHARVEDVKYLA